MAYVRPRKRGGRLQWVLAEKEWHAGKPVEKTRASFGSDTAAAIDASPKTQGAGLRQDIQADEYRRKRVGLRGR